MANKIIWQTPEADNIYTPQMIRRAIGKQCPICNKYISESEANNKDCSLYSIKNIIKDNINTVLIEKLKEIQKKGV